MPTTLPGTAAPDTRTSQPPSAFSATRTASPSRNVSRSRVVWRLRSITKSGVGGLAGGEAGLASLGPITARSRGARRP